MIHNYKRIIGALALSLFFKFSSAQISEGGTPIGISINSNQNEIPVYSMPETPIDDLVAEDINRDKQKSLPFRFGFNHYVNLNLQNSGAWQTLANGDKLWQLAIYSQDAKTINLTFDKYKLPEGAKMFIYSADKHDYIGAFTKRNNQTDGKLGCMLVDGDKCIVEYYQPANAEFEGELQIWRVTHGYRSLRNYAEKSYGQAGTCNNNINCPIGGAWQNEKRSVACIVVGGNENCTGTLINDVAHDGTPYFLTANHCTDGTESTWVFRFNWESATCTNANGPINQTVSGSVVRAKSPNSDFALLELNAVPPANYNVYYAGWSNLDVPADSTIGIHHPNGDIKKISFAPGVTASATYSSATTWQTAEWFDGLQNGATEPGSSGSPLFDTHHRIVGQLFGGPSSCTATAGQRHDFYGKFAASWDSGSTAATRLQNWLDPQNSGATTVDGMNAVAPIANNTGVAAIISPTATATTCDLNVSPQITLFNYGSNTVTQVTINYHIDGNANSTFNWTGNLASSASTTVTLPTIVSPSAGTHTLFATTTMPNGMLDSLPTNDSTSTTFSIIDPTNSVSLPFIEDFTMTTFPANGWRIVNPDNNTTWAFQTGAIASNAPGSTGKSLRFRNKQANASGQVDYAITPFYNFTNQGTPLYMTMYHAYAKYNTANDSLMVAYSIDCGNSWKTIKAFRALDLALHSGGNVTSNTSFVPSADSLWVKDTILINEVAGLQGVQFAFINKTDLGNSLFIDAININDNPVGIKKTEDNNFISVYPNPATDAININFSKQGNYSVTFKSVLGNIVFETKTNNNLKIETTSFAKGVYFIEVVGKEIKCTKKIVIK